eukprot:TRINITY_DN1061_c0_g1_i1.p1 TRINITY_DN1061_c0_g1~~TRINITY_DN1061_c0_g1_i1.p1  ORF type:complete len:199 (+),score=47.98 TRINITY_DN1061_c0_g1_i1:54-599(+)
MASSPYVCPSCKKAVTRADSTDGGPPGGYQTPWHKQCFVCKDCSKPLHFGWEKHEGFSYYAENGEYYCLNCRNRKQGLPERVKVTSSSGWYCSCQHIGFPQFVEAINEKGALTLDEVHCQAACGGPPAGTSGRDNCYSNCYNPWGAPKPDPDKDIEDLLVKAAAGNPILLAKIHQAKPTKP